MPGEKLAKATSYGVQFPARDRHIYLVRFSP